MMSPEVAPWANMAAWSGAFVSTLRDAGEE